MVLSIHEKEAGHARAPRQPEISSGRTEKRNEYKLEGFPVKELIDLNLDK